MKIVYEHPAIQITYFSTENTITTSFGIDGYDINAFELEGW